MITQGQQEVAVGSELDYAIVTVVCDPDVAVVINDDAFWSS